MNDTEATVTAAVLDVARMIAPERASVAATDALREDLGFASLDLAQVVASLEGALGVDPFRKHVAVTAVRTVADLCAAYAQALQSGGEPG